MLAAMDHNAQAHVQLLYVRGPQFPASFAGRSLHVAGPRATVHMKSSYTIYDGTWGSLRKLFTCLLFIILTTVTRAVVVTDSTGKPLPCAQGAPKRSMSSTGIPGKYVGGGTELPVTPRVGCGAVGCVLGQSFPNSAGDGGDAGGLCAPLTRSSRKPG